MALRKQIGKATDKERSGSSGQGVGETVVKNTAKKNSVS